MHYKSDDRAIFDEQTYRINYNACRNKNPLCDYHTYTQIGSYFNWVVHNSLMRVQLNVILVYMYVYIYN